MKPQAYCVRVVVLSLCPSYPNGLGGANAKLYLTLRYRKANPTCLAESEHIGYHISKFSVSAGRISQGKK